MFSERLKKLSPYVPGEQPRDRAYLKLNTNENPYPPSPEIDRLLKSFDIEGLRLYPDPLFLNLREKIARRYGVHPEQVFAGNGSDEILSFCFYAFFDSRSGSLLFPEFTYSFYPVYCDFYDIDYEKIPLSGDYALDLQLFCAKQPSCGVIFPNPNAPTGICLPIGKIDDFLAVYPDDRVVIIDEAYIDFGGDSAVSLISSHPNLLIVRTFSKSMSLAGLRLGFAMGDAELVATLFAVKDSFNSYPVNALAQQIGGIALEDRDYFETVTKKIIASREYLTGALAELGWTVLPSKANFIFAGAPDFSGEEIYLKLKTAGILVRYFPTDGIKNFVRITIGTPRQMEKLVSVVKQIFGREIPKHPAEP